MSTVKEEIQRRLDEKGYDYKYQGISDNDEHIMEENREEYVKWKIQRIEDYISQSESENNNSYRNLSLNSNDFYKNTSLSDEIIIHVNCEQEIYQEDFQEFLIGKVSFYQEGKDFVLNFKDNNIKPLDRNLRSSLISNGVMVEGTTIIYVYNLTYDSRSYSIKVS